MENLLSQTINLQSYLKERQQEIEAFLDKSLPTNELAKKLWEAMRYSTLNGGKRIRGILCLAAYEALGKTDWQKLLPIAAGLECIHAMSLIHDDLPCMDNDDLRRGKPTCHKAYDEATALLAGDALLVEGISLCLQVQIEAQSLVQITQLLVKAVGAYGMTGGQMIDLVNTNQENISFEELQTMHRLKTGAFLKASVLIGAIAGKASEEQLGAFETYAENIGLAFQIADDLLDLESDSVTLGKTAGKDLAQNKTTYPKLLGIEASRQKANNLVKDAKEILLIQGIQSEALSKIADYIVLRKY